MHNQTQIIAFPDWPGHCKDTLGQSPIEIEGSDLGAGNHPSVTDIELINYDMNVSLIVETCNKDQSKAIEILYQFSFLLYKSKI